VLQALGCLCRSAAPTEKTMSRGHFWRTMPMMRSNRERLRHRHSPLVCGDLAALRLGMRHEISLACKCTRRAATRSSQCNIVPAEISVAVSKLIRWQATEPGCKCDPGRRGGRILGVRFEANLHGPALGNGCGLVQGYLISTKSSASVVQLALIPSSVLTTGTPISAATRMAT